MQLYERVFEDLYKKIKTGYYNEGDLIPSEKELEKIYSVSRAPIRQALGKLESIDLIDRKQGKGTYVKKSEKNDSRACMSGFGMDFSKCWSHITCKTLNVDEVEPTPDIVKKLALKEGEKVVKVERVRYVDGFPIFYLIHYSKYIDVDGVKEEGNFNSLRHLLIEKFKLPIALATEEIKAVFATEEIAKILSVSEGYPLLKIERLSLDHEYNPLEYVRYYVKTEEWTYKVNYNK
ncbi:MAG: GntR family transcriptional regulator [Marinisporobacter sp.]|nr:GntR family transcriptional regulator [Marinisporobacter sp.]